MGDLPEIGPAERHAVTLRVAPCWADHRFQGRAVLPAVEAMQLLAHWTARLRPGLPVRSIVQASFGKFLDLPPGSESLAVYCDLTDLADGAVRAALTTRTKGASTTITRTKIHAQVVFAAKSGDIRPPALDLAAGLAGPCFNVAPQSLYDELVPFGLGYRNISRPLQLTGEGALAWIHAPDLQDRQTGAPLGSPFVADAAFHAACVWGQRFADVVAFPVGIDERLILDPTRPGETYASRVFPVRTDGGTLVFDIWILGLDGGLRECLHGVRMRDVSGGRLRPPVWIGAGREVDLLQPLAGQCAAISLVERDTLMPFADRCLSDRERQRMEKMGLKRRSAYLAARLACKRLVRSLCGDDRQTPATAITTVAADGVRPHCPSPIGTPSFRCSVSHDRCLAVAAAAQGPIGVDVEIMNTRLLKSVHLFMSTAEQEHVQSSVLGPGEAAVRVWSIKECVAKALGIHLVDAWRRVEVTDIGVDKSCLRVQPALSMQAFHQRWGCHLLTLVKSEE